MNQPLYSSAEAPEGTDDLRALAWVQDEVRKSLEAAHKALRRQLKEADSLGASDVDVVDPSVLRGARNQLHQAAGALEIVGLSVPAQLVRVCETTVQRMIGRSSLVTAKAVDTIEHTSFAVLDFVARRVAGKHISGVALFPQYRAAQELAGADRVHPADLWSLDWRWREIDGEPGLTPRAADATARETMERMMLRLMRKPDRATLHRMSDLCAELGAAAGGRLATLWRLGAAFFEAQSSGLLRGDVFVKRAGTRLLAQARVGVNPDDASERLAHDLLFFCARAQLPTPERPAPRLDAVRRAWGLAPTDVLPDYETSLLGRFDPALLAQARKRVSAARDAWSAVAGDDLHRISTLAETFALVGDSLRRLYPNGEHLAQALSGAAQQSAQTNAAPPTALAMEVATSVLYLEASLEDAELDHPDLARRIERLAQRVDDVRAGTAPQPLEGWMEEIYRRVSDRQTMGSVVQELRSSLSEAEKQIDQYFRDPSQRELLYPVPGLLSAMRGVLSVLGMDQASQAVLRMRDDVDALAQTEVDPQQAAGAGSFERLAESLGALSFLIDVLGVQPQLAKSLFRYDAASGRLKALMGKTVKAPAFVDSTHESGPDLSDRAQQIAHAATRDDVSDDTLAGQLDRLAQQALIAEERTLAQTVSSAKAALAGTTSHEERRALRSDLAQAVQNLTGAPAAPVQAPKPAPMATPTLAPGDDSEMREIFIEEAREVVQDARDALQRMTEPVRDSRDDLSDLTVLRRAFHTLKGSSRMVGLNAYGEAAWACEQLYNARLAQGSAVDDPLRQVTGQALGYLNDWVDAIAEGRDSGHGPSSVVAAADALRLDGRLLSIGSEPDPAAPLADLVSDLPAPFELDLGSLDSPAPPPPATADDSVPAPALREPDALPNLGDLAMPEWEPETADIGMAATMPLMQPFREPEPAPPAPTIETIQLDLGAFDAATELMPVPAVSELPAEPEPVSVPVAEAIAESAAEAAPEEGASPAEEPVKVVGPLRIDIAMFNIYLNEADELSRRLSTDIAEWATAANGPPGESPVVLAHSLAGSSATVGFGDLSALARAFEHALTRSNDAQRFSPDEPALYIEAADDIRRLLHQFAAGFLKTVAPGLIDRLESYEPALESMPETAAEPALPVAEIIDEVAAPMLPVAAPLVALEPLPEPSSAPSAAPSRELVFDDEDEIDATDAVDEQLFPIFADEAEDLVPQLQSRMRDWMARAGDSGAAAACMRTLHTFKGGARLAGAMRVGEMAHRLETAIERLLARGDIQSADVEPLLGRVDAIEAAFVQLRAAVDGSALPVAAAPAALPTVTEAVAEASAPMPLAAAEPVAMAPGDPSAPATLAAPQAGAIDWSRFAGTGARAAAVRDRSSSVSQAAVRVRAPMLDRLVSHAGEVSIARARIEADVGNIKSSLGDLTENLERMRRQLRDIEVQAESQIGSRLEAAKAAAVEFDPLEMDRYTRFQELTRMMAESVNDVATVQRGLQRSLQSAEDQLAAQARLTRSLQDDLLRTRMVEFDALADRLYRVVRHAAKETGRQVRLDIVGGATEVDRGVLDRMTGPFEHLLRNCVTHGIESPEQRVAAGKDGTGAIQIALRQEGNEVALEFRDDGAGLDLARIRERGIAMGLIDPQADPAEATLVDLIFAPGFSTARELTGLAGRGIGLDVVRSEVIGMGGRIETDTTPGQGTRFRMVLPLTTAVTQVVLLRCGDVTVAVPSTLIDVVRRVRAEDVEDAYTQGQWHNGEATLPFFWLGALLGATPRGAAAGRSVPVVVIRSAAQRVALHVDEVLGNQEVVVKNLGPQLARLPGLAGVTLLPSGAVAPIYNPVALATLYGQAARDRLRQAAVEGQRGAEAAETPVKPEQAPLVLVVDDSLTVRRVTQRLLVREGYRVITAKDGLEALERLAEERPAVLLSDIEMPRMDGFDLVRNVRADARLAGLPVIMITSRIAQKHRDYAAELGVQHYLGKPYGEEELLALVARHSRLESVAA